MRGWMVFGLSVLVHTAPVLADERLAQAERWLAETADGLIDDDRINPRWLSDGRRFWYASTPGDSVRYYLVDPARQRRAPLFDHRGLARSLAKVANTPVVADRLEVLGFEASPDAPAAVTLAVSGKPYRCGAAKPHACARAAALPAADEVVSPNGQHVAFMAGFDLYVRSVNGDTRRLTDFGERHRGVQRRVYGDAVSNKLLTERRGALPPNVRWSPDSRRLLAVVVDMRGVREEHLIQSSPVDGGAPVHHSHRKSWGGDKDIGSAEVAIFDVSTGKAWYSPSHVLWNWGTEFTESFWWANGSAQAYWLEAERGGRKVALRSVDLRAAQPMASTVYTEASSTAVFLAPELYWMTPNVRVIADGAKLIWWSERDGWGHLYLIDAATGQVERQLTSGDWSVFSILHVDEAAGWVYMTAGGREAGSNPYLQQLYRVSLAEARLERLSQEPGVHDATVAPSGAYLVDRYSTMQQPPRTVLRDSGGTVLMRLGEANIDRLAAVRWQPPEPVEVLAADGVTKLYGQIYKPTDLDARLAYPVVVDTYPGIFTQHVAHRFGFSSFSEPTATAELGFVVVRLDGRASAFRSRAFREFGNGTTGLAGLVDLVAGLRQLGAARPYMDLDRVGIYGVSLGGDATVRALSEFPDLFKAGVAMGLSGPTAVTHEAEFGETWHGPLADSADIWAREAHRTWIPRLKGKLFLLHGEMDDHANPAIVMQYVNDLLAADKPFEVLFYPNVDHGGVDLTTGELSIGFIKARWRFLTRELGGPRARGTTN